MTEQAEGLIAKIAREDRESLVATMTAFQTQYETLTAGLAKMEARRGELYVHGRDSKPPLTFRELAEIFKVTPAAIMQKESRARKQLDEAKATS